MVNLEDIFFYYIYFIVVESEAYVWTYYYIKSSFMEFWIYIDKIESIKVVFGEIFEIESGGVI